MAERTVEQDHGRSDLSTVDARQGMMLGRMRYVLAVSTALTVAAFLVVIAFFYWP
jgi:hypothetical protein